MHRPREILRTLVLVAIAAFSAMCSAEKEPVASRRGLDPVWSSGGSGAETGIAFGSDNWGPLENASDPLAHTVDGSISDSMDDAGPTGGDVPDPPLTSDNSCGKARAEARLEPVNMFVMMDRSGSMDDDNKWIDVAAALLTFFRDPKAAGMRVALRFFPHDFPAEGCTDAGCDPVACSQPLVELGELLPEYGEDDPQERALVLGIVNSNPGNDRKGSGTPTHPALDGALRWATSYQTDHTGEKTVVVFATDGEPNGCNTNFDEIAALASDALATQGIHTYAIGFEGANAAQITQLAQAGGTDQGIFVDPGPTAEQALVMALNGIRGEALSCDVAMPKPADASMTIDPKRINVTFTPSAGSPGTFAQVPSQDACAAKKSWYYDAPDSPTRIFLCPAACDLVRSDSKANLEILIGCATACGGLDMSCGGEPPPTDVPPILF